MTRSHRQIAAALLEDHGTTYAHQAGIRLADKPSLLYRLLVLATLLSTRIDADIAVAAARELSAAGFRTPQRMLDATWQQRVDALGRGHYRRYDESTATRLGDGAQLLLDTYRGDLRSLRSAGDGPQGVLERLQDFPGIGPTGAAIFVREAQGLWPELAPFFDRKALDGARRLGLPEDPETLDTLIDPADRARLAAALVRAALRKVRPADLTGEDCADRPNGPSGS
ncbi:endonuclease [Brachybacterium alimentarium]|uniref:endonuclease n=1 Tax=Brachybacterium alimentarium TaxID=47845 RepID=UPI003FD2130F